MRAPRLHFVQNRVRRHRRYDLTVYYSISLYIIIMMVLMIIISCVVSSSSSSSIIRMNMNIYIYI